MAFCVNNFNNTTYDKYLCKIYPQELSITKETHSDKEASYLDIFIVISDIKFHTKLNFKRDSFGFTVINCQYPVTSSVPEKPACGGCASQIISFAGACDHCIDFSDRHVSLCESLLRQGYKCGFWLSSFVVLLRRNRQCLQGIRIHLRTLEGMFPLHQWWSVLGLLQSYLSQEGLVLNIHSVFSVGGEGRLGTHKGLNITRES